MTNELFYEDLDLKYPEIAIALTSGSKKVKVYIPVLMPFVENVGKVNKDTKDKMPSKTNIISKESITLSATTTHNYIELDVSKLGSVKKKDKIVVVFISGDPNKPVAIGRC